MHEDIGAPFPSVFKKHLYANALKLHDPTDLEQDQEKFSPQGENFSVMDSTIDRVVDGILSGSNLIAEPSANAPIEDFYAAFIRQCRASGKEYTASKTVKDKMARRHLLDVGTFVISPIFNVVEFAKRFDIKITKAIHKNPFRLVLKISDPDRSDKDISKLSRAIQHAVEQCQHNPNKLADYFVEKSMSQCLLDRKAALKVAKKAATQETADESSIKAEILLRQQKLVSLKLDDVPSHLIGRFTVEIEIENGKPRFIGLIDPHA